MPKINCLELDSRNLNQHQLLSHAEPDFSCLMCIITLQALVFAETSTTVILFLLHCHADTHLKLKYVRHTYQMLTMVISLE